jgi:predicted GNAT family acetyltransferase
MADTDFTPLDNPIWSALTTVHRSVAIGNGRARRYPTDMSPMWGMRETSAEAFADLAAMVAPQETVALVTVGPVEVPANWQIVRTRWLDQMICTETIEPPSAVLLPLQPEDVSDMLALTAATEPGPFRPRTIEMGDYFGIRSADGRLVAMAGERLQLDRFTEISAVCTDPTFRGRGYGRALVSFLAAKIQAAKKTPFLHVLPENGAKAMYQKVGFRLRRTLHLTVVTLR